MPLINRGKNEKNCCKILVKICNVVSKTGARMSPAIVGLKPWQNKFRITRSKNSSFWRDEHFFARDEFFKTAKIF